MYRKTRKKRKNHPEIAHVQIKEEEEEEKIHLYSRIGG